MKKTVLFLSLIAALISSCAKGYDEGQNLIATGKQIEITAYTDIDTKTGLVSDGGGKSVEWKAGDAISLFFNEGTDGGDKFTTTTTGALATFRGTISAISGDLSSTGGNAYFWGLYPYNENASCDGTYLTTSLPSVQSSPVGDVANNLLVTVGRSENLSIYFKNTLSVVGFTLSQENISQVVFSGNAGEKLAGEYKVSYDGTSVVDTPTDYAVERITIKPSESETFEVGKTYYFAFLPGTFSAGYSLKFTKADGSVATYKKTTASTFKISMFYTMTKKDNGLTFTTPTDLSVDETANSYIVSEAGLYKIPTVKGNTSESVGTVASAEVLWESFGTDTAPSVGDLVSDASYADGYITFTASDEKGNAVIAAKDASGNILWSWHIWMTDKPVDQVYNNNAGTMMDRNLGATSATPSDVHALGLLYQWGRKDPFLSGGSIDSNTPAASTITWPSLVTSDVSTGTIEYTVANPTTFLIGNNSNYDWHYTGSSSTDNTRWPTSDSSKGLYDPCPAGYRVPDGGHSGLWSRALNTSEVLISTTDWDETNKGMDFGSTDRTLGTGSIWYPAAGYLGYSNGSLSNVGTFSYYWSCTPKGYNEYYMCFGDNGNIRPASSGRRAFGQSVRCIKEGTQTKTVTDLSADGTANSYIVSKPGEYKIQTVKGNSTESVGTVASAEVLWESFGTDTAPTVGYLVCNATYNNGYISFIASDQKGNAVIAAKDSDGTILWSWHIWMTDKPEDQVYNNNAGTMMDRNLGATSATPGDVKALGLLYQWGRKDPFLGSSSINTATRAASTITWPTTVNVNTASNGTNTLAYATSSPTVFINSSSSSYDWYCPIWNYKNDELWSSTKTEYDPCPTGYKVPDGGSSGIWSTAFGTSSYWTPTTNWDSTNRGRDFGTTNKPLGSGTIWYPASGCLTNADGSLTSVGSNSYYWTCTPNGDSSYSMALYCNGRVYPVENRSRSIGCSVRCCKE